MGLSIYVTNKTQGVERLYVRVRGNKLKELEIYSRIISETSVALSGEGKVGKGGDEGPSAGGKGGLNISHKHEDENRKR